MTSWSAVSKKMEWPEILGKECCVPRVKTRIDAKEASNVNYAQAAEAFVAFSIANGMDGRVEEGDKVLKVDIEDGNQRGMEYLAACTPKPVWWAASSALAEGRSVTLICKNGYEN